MEDMSEVQPSAKRNGTPNQTGATERNGIRPSPAPHKGYLDESNSRSAFQPRDVGELFQDSIEEIPWICKGYLFRGGLTLLAGSPKIGKTTWAYQLIEQVALGGIFLGDEVTQAKVLLLGLEEHKRDIIARLRNRSGEGIKGWVKVQFGPLPYTSSIYEEMADYIMCEDIGLVVIDTIPAWWNLSDENDASEVIRKGYPLVNVIRRTNAAWLGLVHTRKSGGEHGEDIRGSSALLGLVDLAVSMKRAKGGGNQRVLEAASRYTDTPKELVIEYEESGYKKVGTPAEVSSQAKANQVWERLTPQGKTIEELAIETNLSKQDVSRAIKVLGERVHRDGSGTKGDPYRFSANSIHPTTNSEDRTRIDELLMRGEGEGKVLSHLR